MTKFSINFFSILMFFCFLDLYSMQRLKRCCCCCKSKKELKIINRKYNEQDFIVLLKKRLFEKIESNNMPKEKLQGFKLSVEKSKPEDLYQFFSEEELRRFWQSVQNNAEESFKKFGRIFKKKFLNLSKKKK